MTASVARRGIAALFAGRVVEKIIGFAALVLYARFFTPAELALVPLFFLFGNLGPVLFGFGIMPTLVLELPKLASTQPGRAASLARHALGLGMLVALGAATITYFYSQRFMGQTLDMSSATTLWLALGVGLQGQFILLKQMLVGTSRFVPLAVTNTVTSVLRLVLLVPLHQAVGVTGIAAGLAIAGGAGCIFALWQLKGLLLNRTHGDDYSYAGMFRLSWPFYLEGYLMYFRSQGDQLVVTGILGTEALAQYYIARRLYDLLRALSDSVESALIPLLSRLSLEGRDHFAKKWHILFRSALSFGILAALICIAATPFYIAVLGAEKYRAALVPTIILILVFLMDLLKIVIGRSIFVLCPPIKRLQLTVFESVILLPFLLGGTLLMGVTGAALAGLLAGAAATAFAYHMLRNTVPVNVTLNDLTEVLLPSMVAFGAMAVVMAWAIDMLTGNIVGLGLATGFGVAVFLFVFVNLASVPLLSAMMGGLGFDKVALISSLLSKVKLVRR